MENNFKIDESLLLDGTEKVGEMIWTINGGYEKIINIEENRTFRIVTEYCSYTKEGLIYERDILPSAFKRNPFVSQYPKLMEVSDKGDEWYVKNVLCEMKGKFVTTDRLFMWSNAREIQPKAVEFSEVQIKYLESKGINVNDLKTK